MTIIVGHDSAGARKTLSVAGKSIAYYSNTRSTGRRAWRIRQAARRAESGAGKHASLRGWQEQSQDDDIRAFAEWATNGGKNPRESCLLVPPACLMQDFTGVPAVVDLAAMRDGIKALGGDAQKIQPAEPGRSGH